MRWKFVISRNIKLFKEHQEDEGRWLVINKWKRSQISQTFTITPNAMSKHCSVWTVERINVE